MLLRDAVLEVEGVVHVLNSAEKFHSFLIRALSKNSLPQPNDSVEVEAWQVDRRGRLRGDLPLHGDRRQLQLSCHLRLLRRLCSARSEDRAGKS